MIWCRRRRKAAEDDMRTPLYPSLYQINTRVWLTELSRTLGRTATLDDIPDAELDRLAGLGLDWVWFLSVWQTGPAGQRISRTNPEWRREFQETLPDSSRGGYRGLRLRHHGLHRSRWPWRRRGARASPRAASHERSAAAARFRPQPHGAGSSVGGRASEYYVQGTEADLLSAPQNYIRITGMHGGSRFRPRS
jgi:hypothetical protein